MNRISLIFVFIGFSCSIFCQEKKVYFHQIGSLQQQELELIDMILKDKKIRKKSNDFILYNVIEDQPPKDISDASNRLNPYNIINKNYPNEQSVRDKIEENITKASSNTLSKKSKNTLFIYCYTSSKNWIFSQIADFENVELTSLNKKSKKKFIKKLRKKKYDKVHVILDNGFVECKYCEENISKRSEQELIPEIFLKPSQIIRPIDKPSKYRIEFENVKGFKIYEIEIMGPSGILFKDKIEISKTFNPDRNLNLNLNYNEEELVFSVSDKYLGQLCYSLEEDLTIDNVLKEDCNCQQECLYNKEFAIRVRGVSRFLPENHDIWSKYVRIYFQCSK